MRIIHLVPEAVIGGAERIALQLAKHQMMSGNEVELWFLFGGGPIVAQAERTGLKARLCGVRGSLDIFGTMKLIRLIARYRPDIIHVHGFTTGFLAALLYRKQSIIIQHEHSGLFNRNNWRTNFFEKIIRRVVHLGDAYVAVSEMTKLHLMRTFPIQDKEVHVIYNGVDLSQFIWNKDLSPKRRDLGIPEYAPVIGTVGRLIKEKRIDDFLRAAAIIRKELPEAHFVIVGDGPCREELASLADDLGLRGAVSMLGMRNDVPELLAAFDLFILTSNWESFGIVIVEAMASGIPVLAFRANGVTEIIKEDCGILLPPGDVEGLARQALILIRDSDKRACFSSVCQQYAANFSIEVTLKKVDQLYSDLISARREKAIEI